AGDAEIKVTVSNAADSSCVVVFPQATDNELVHHYLIEILDGQKVVATYRTFSQFYLNSQMPASLSVKLSGLPPKKKLIARVTAIDSYKNQSVPMKSKAFKIYNHEQNQ
ncbi:MAG: hypothetical protein LBU51_10835, partial [Bacteroidales bacterium]|nr:hypothetical protein [Bacteroidales bacterium]